MELHGATNLSAGNLQCLAPERGDQKFASNDTLLVALGARCLSPIKNNYIQEIKIPRSKWPATSKHFVF